MLLKVVGVSDSQLLQLLQPLDNQLPNTPQQYRELLQRIRRMAHVMEHRPNNIAQSLRRPHDHAPTLFWANAETWQESAQAYPAWSQSSNLGPAGAAPSSSGSTTPFAAWWTHEQYATSSWFTEGDDRSGNGTDTDTSSSDGLTNYDTSDLPQTRDAGELLQHAYWAYAKAKGRWRRLTAKPVRRTRRFLKRSFGKGFSKGSFSQHFVDRLRSKGKGRGYTYLGMLEPHDMEQIFKGKAKGKGSGKGFGRRSGNPKGKDGEVLKCHNCGSTEHLAARCTQRPGFNTGHIHTPSSPPAASWFSIPESAPESAFSDGPLAGFETEATYLSSAQSSTNPTLAHTYLVNGGDDEDDRLDATDVDTSDDQSAEADEDPITENDPWRREDARQTYTWNTRPWRSGFWPPAGWQDDRWSAYEAPGGRGPTLQDFAPNFEAELARALHIPVPGPDLHLEEPPPAAKAAASEAPLRRPPLFPRAASDAPPAPLHRSETAFQISSASSLNGPSRAAWAQWGQEQQRRASDAAHARTAAQQPYFHAPPLAYSGPGAPATIRPIWPMNDLQMPQLPAWCTLPSMNGITAEVPADLGVLPMEHMFAPRGSTLSDIESRLTIDYMHEINPRVSQVPPAQEVTASGARLGGPPSRLEPEHQSAIEALHQLGIHHTQSRDQRRHQQQSQHLLRPKAAAAAPPGLVAEDYVDYTGTDDQCSICADHFAAGDDVLRLRCRHCFHGICYSEYVAHHPSEGQPSCPNCRGGGQIVARFTYIADPTPRAPEPRAPSTESFRTAYPCWPVPAETVQMDVVGEDVQPAEGDGRPSVVNMTTYHCFSRRHVTARPYQLPCRSRRPHFHGWSETDTPASEEGKCIWT